MHQALLLSVLLFFSMGTSAKSLTETIKQCSKALTGFEDETETAECGLDFLIQNAQWKKHPVLIGTYAQMGLETLKGFKVLKDRVFILSLLATASDKAGSCPENAARTNDVYNLDIKRTGEGEGLQFCTFTFKDLNKKKCKQHLLNIAPYREIYAFTISNVSKGKPQTHVSITKELVDNNQSMIELRNQCKRSGWGGTGKNTISYVIKSYY